jgi:hypothetical protein
MADFQAPRVAGFERPLTDKVARNDLERIFGRWSDPVDKVRSAGSFLRYISDRIDPGIRAMYVSKDIAGQFESACLWIRKTLPDLAPEVREQAVKLLNESRAEETVATLGALSERTRVRLRFRQSASFIAKLSSALGLLKVGIADSTVELLREENLQAAKVAIGRLAGMLDYAAIDLDSVEEHDDVVYRDHFKPNQIDRRRMQDLLDRLVDQIGALPDSATKQQLLVNVGELKREVERPRPRWRSFLGKAIIILAVVADIKTMHPTICDDALATLDAIIRTVVSESKGTPRNSLPVEQPENGPKHWAIELKRIEFRPPDEDAEDDKDGHKN